MLERGSLRFLTTRRVVFYSKNVHKESTCLAIDAFVMSYIVLLFVVQNTVLLESA